MSRRDRREYLKGWKARNPDKVRENRYQWKYGISLEEYHELEKAQGGLCAICQQAPKERLYVDHDHKTSIVRGLLCNNCNVSIGRFGDSIVNLRRAIEYLEKNSE